METEKRTRFLQNLPTRKVILVGLLVGLPIVAMAAIGYYFFFGTDRLQQQRAAQFVTNSNTPQYPIIGNRKTRIYHWHGCPNYFDVAPNNQVIFASPEEAEQRRFRPAENCSGAPPRAQTR